MKRRPKHLNLLTIRQPLPAIVSILHRISGALLFLFIPLLLVWLQASLVSEQAFSSFREWFASPLAKLVFIVLAWAYIHHFFAGMRFLFLDLNYGVELKSARASSAAVLVLSLVLTFGLGVAIW